MCSVFVIFTDSELPLSLPLLLFQCMHHVYIVSLCSNPCPLLHVPLIVKRFPCQKRAPAELNFNQVKITDHSLTPARLIRLIGSSKAFNSDLIQLEDQKTMLHPQVVYLEPHPYPPDCFTCQKVTIIVWNTIPATCVGLYALISLFGIFFGSSKDAVSELYRERIADFPLFLFP